VFDTNILGKVVGEVLIRVLLLREGHLRVGVPKPQENTSMRISPYVNNSFFIFSLPFHLVEEKYLHRNMVTYKIGEAPPSVTA
jgi:hypothetical protein